MASFEWLFKLIVRDELDLNPRSAFVVVSSIGLLSIGRVARLNKSVYFYSQ